MQFLRSTGLRLRKALAKGEESRYLKWFHHPTLRLRLLLFIFLPLVIALVLLGLSIFSHFEEQGDKQMQEEVQLIARALQIPLARALEKNRPGSVEQALQSAFRFGRIYGASLYDTNAIVLASAGNVATDHDHQTTLSRVIEEGKQFGEFSRVAGRSNYSYFVPLEASTGNRLGLLQITRRESDFTEYFKNIRNGAAFYLLIGIGLVTTIVFVGYHNAIGKSLRRLRATMARIETGDFTSRATYEGPIEIQQLAQALNEMLDSMAAARAEIEQRRQAEETLENQLKRSEKLAAVGQVAAGVAHELGTPLSLIDGKAQRLRRKAPKEDSVGHMAEEIRDEVRRMERLIRQLLELGRPAGRHRKAVRIAQVVDMAVQSTRELCDHQKVLLETTGDRPGPVVEADPFRLELAFGNLVLNAIQATPMGGTVALKWRHTSEGIELAVHDSGPGIPPGSQAQIFDAFFTTKKSGKGRGLGLSVVHQVIDEHRGRIQVGDSPIGGALFRVVLPQPSSIKGSD